MGFLKLFQRGKPLFSAYSLIIRKVHSEACPLKITGAVLSTNLIYKMQSAYFQCNEESQKVHVNINYYEGNIRSLITLVRPILENVGSFLNRVELKLQKSVSKKLKKKLKETDKNENDSTVIKVCLLLNDELVPEDVKFVEMFQNNLKGEFKLRINDVDYDVFLNSPMVLKMTLPKKIYAGTLCFPEALETEYMDEEKSEYIWYKSKTPHKKKNWEMCGEGFFYLIKEEDIGYHLKNVCTPKMNDKVGPVFEVTSASGVFEFKALKEIKKRHEFTKEATKPDEFRIVSYNILADTYTQTKEAKTDLFIHCDPAYLDFAYRKTLCTSELLGYNADIICMQEVDKSFYHNCYLLFSKNNYACEYHEKEGAREGCLVLYNTNKFNILSVNQYVFTKELLNNPLLNDIKLKIEGNENLIGRLKGIQSLIQVVVLESFSDNILIIGNTHFYFHPNADHIRLLQGVLSWKFLQNTYEEMKEKHPDKKYSVMLCGDLNSTPECGFHEFLNTGFLSSDHIDWKSKEDEAITGLSSQHTFKIKSAYDNTQYTNYIPLFKGCLDYIYYQTDYLKLKQTVPIPSEEVLSCYSGIPSEFFPSDHVALIADFKFEK